MTFADFFRVLAAAEGGIAIVLVLWVGPLYLKRRTFSSSADIRHALKAMPAHLFLMSAHTTLTTVFCTWSTIDLWGQPITWRWFAVLILNTLALVGGGLMYRTQRRLTDANVPRM